jgi:hypothetical protein
MKIVNCSVCNIQLGKWAYQNGSKFCKKCMHITHKTSCQCASCKSKRKELSKENHPNYKHGKTFAVAYCCDCNKKLHFQAVLYDNKRCKDCAAKEKGKNIQGEKHPNYIDGRSLIDHFCKNEGCNNKISLYNFFTGKHTCKECYMKFQKIPENNINWQGGLSFLTYTPQWNKMLRGYIRDRDNHTCQLCHKTEEKTRVLDVHHIDYNKQNCNENNLISLCQLCHVKSNFNRKYWQEYYTLFITNLYINK